MYIYYPVGLAVSHAKQAPKQTGRMASRYADRCIDKRRLLPGQGFVAIWAVTNCHTGGISDMSEWHLVAPRIPAAAHMHDATRNLLPY